MKLLRYGPMGHEKPGILDRDGHIRDLSGTIKDINGETLSPASLDRLKKLDLNTLPLVSGSPRSPFTSPRTRRISPPARSM